MAQQYPTHPGQLQQHPQQMAGPGQVPGGVPHPGIQANQHAMQHFNPVYGHPNQMSMYSHPREHYLYTDGSSTVAVGQPSTVAMQQQALAMRQRAAVAAQQQAHAQAQAAQMGMVNGVGNPAMYAAAAEGRMVQQGYPGGAHSGMPVGPGGQVFAGGVPPQMRLVQTPAGMQQVVGYSTALGISDSC